MQQRRNSLALFVWEQPRLLDTSASTCSKPLPPAGSAVGSHHGAPQVLKTSNDRAWATCSCAAYPNSKKYSLVSSQNYFSLLAACSCLTRKGSVHHSRQLCDQLSAAAPAGDAGSFCQQARPNKGLLNKFHEYWQWTVLFHAYFFKLSNSASMSPIPPAGQMLLRDGCTFCMERAQHRYPASASTGKGNGFTSHVRLWKPWKTAKRQNVRMFYYNLTCYPTDK